MKTLSSLLIICLTMAFCSQTKANAQSLSDTATIAKISMMYIDGFVDGKPEMLAECLSEDLYKFGFRLNADTKEYEDAGILTYQSAQDLAKKIGDAGGRNDPDAPKEVKILDVQGPIASVKVTAIWGYDYMLLAKKEGKWKIEQILWVGPLEKTTTDQ